MFAIDLDGTTVDTATNARRIMSERLGVTLTPARTTMADLYDGIPQDLIPAASDVLSRGFNQDEYGMYTSAQPMPRAADALNWLARRNLLSAYITYRPVSVADRTLAWFKRNNFPNAPLLHASSDQPKPELMRSVRATVLIDDDLSTIRQVLTAGYGAIWFSARTNAGVVSAPEWTGLASFLTHLPLDYRERYERGF